MPGNTLASRTMNLNFVNLLACIQLASDWFKNNPLLSELTHAHYREPVPLMSKNNSKYCVYLFPVSFFVVRSKGHWSSSSMCDHVWSY